MKRISDNHFEFSMPVLSDIIKVCRTSTTVLIGGYMGQAFHRIDGNEYIRCQFGEFQGEGKQDMDAIAFLVNQEFKQDTFRCFPEYPHIRDKEMLRVMQTVAVFNRIDRYDLSFLVKKEAERLFLPTFLGVGKGIEAPAWTIPCNYSHIFPDRVLKGTGNAR